MYYDLKKILSFNAFLNFLIGERGVGKTYSLSKFVTNQFIKKDYQFVYIRRYRKDLKEGMDDFYTSLIKNDEFLGHRLETSSNKFKVDDKIAGFGFCLSSAQSLKGKNFDNVKYIIFDEFLVEEDGHHHYLQNEVKVFLGLVESIARTRDIKIFMLGNSTSLVNPYFLFFNVPIPYNTDIKLFKEGLILVQLMQNKAYREFKKQTKLGKLVSGTDYENYAIENKFKDDNKDFIKKKTKNAKCTFGFIYKNNIYGVWCDFLEGSIYVSSDVNTKLIFATTTNELTPNTLLLSVAKKYHSWQVFIKGFKSGCVFYENLKIKLAVQDILSRLI